MSLDTILSDYSSPLEVCLEIDSIRRSDGTLKTWYFSTNIRETSASETPANTPFLPFLRLGSVLGPLSQSLSEDTGFSGLATNNPGTITLLQSTVDNDQLSALNDYVFAGYVARIKVGRRSDLYASFALYRTISVSIDPIVKTTDKGLQATFQLSSVLDRALKESLISKHYVGIPTCGEVLTTTAAATAAYNAALDLKTFTVMYKVSFTALPASNRNLIAKVSTLTNDNFQLNITTSGFVHCLASIANVSTTFHLTNVSLADGIFHTIVFGVLDKTTSYLMIDGEVISTFTPSGSVDHPAVGIRMARFLLGKHLDGRVYNRYILPDEARGISSIRSDGLDLGCVACYIFDDGGSATTINDYSTLGLDATWAGVLNTDYRWSLTDLGELEQAGQMYPIVAGNVLNVKAHLIDSFRERYRGNVDATDWHTSTSNTGLVVKSQGTILTGGGVDYTAPTNGGDGVFSMTSQEGEPVTYDLLNNGTDEQDVYPTSVAKSILINRTRLTSGDLKNVEAMQILCPWPGGYYTESETTAQQTLQEIIGECGIHYYEDREGDIFFDMLIPPTGYGPYGEPVYDFMGRFSDGVRFGNVGGVSGNFTVAGWFKINLADQTAFNFGVAGFGVGTIRFLSKSDPTGNYSVFFEATGVDAGKLVFRSASQSVKSVVGAVQPYIWYFVGCVFDDTNNIMRLYLAPQGSVLQEIATIANSNSPVADPSLDLMIGGAAYSWMSTQHMQVWNSAKTLAQLQALMANPPVGNEAGLLAYIPANEGFGIPREIVSGNVGTLNTTPVAEWKPKFTVDLNLTPSIKLSDFHHLHPAWSVVVEYNRNRFPMSNSDIDSGVSQNNRLKLTAPFLTAPFESDVTRERFKNAKKITHKTHLTDAESAQKLLRNTVNRFGTNNYIGSLFFPPGLNESRLSCGLQIGDEVGIRGNIPSQLLATPLSFKVVSIAPNPLQMTNNIVVYR